MWYKLVRQHELQKTDLYIKFCSNVLEMRKR